jgi:hypothetical protein
LVLKRFDTRPRASISSVSRHTSLARFIRRPPVASKHPSDPSPRTARGFEYPTSAFTVCFAAAKRGKMGRRRWGILLAVVVGGDDDLRSRLASRAAAIRAARGEKGAPPPPVVLRPLAPRVDHSDVGHGDAVAGAAGVTVPVAIDGADARLRAEPGEALIVAARRFAEAHLSRYEGGGCGVGDRSCVVDRLYEALREEDAALRAAAAERDAARHQKILAAVGLVVIIAGMALHHLKQRAQHEVAAAAARAEARSAAAAAALRAAHETRIKEIRAKASTSREEAEEVQRLKRANEALRRQLRDKEPVSVSLASVPSRRPFFLFTRGVVRRSLGLGSLCVSARGRRRGDGVATPLHAIAATLADERRPNAIDAIQPRTPPHRSDRRAGP